MNIWSDFAHSNSLPSHLSLRTFMNQPEIFGVASFVASQVPKPVPLIFLAFFWFDYRLFSKLPLRCPPEAYIAM